MKSNQFYNSSLPCSLTQGASYKSIDRTCIVKSASLFFIPHTVNQFLFLYLQETLVGQENLILIYDCLQMSLLNKKNDPQGCN